MKVLVKFSDLRKLQDKANRMKEMHDDFNRKLDTAIKNEKNFREIIKNKDTEIIKLQCKLDEVTDTTEEIKLLTAENNVLTEENNRLKTYAERKQPKFWFGDRVRIKKDTDEEFIIGRMLLENDVFLFSDALEDYYYYEEHELELVYENISK